MSSTSIASGVLTPATATLTLGKATLNGIMVQPSATVTVYDGVIASPPTLLTLVTSTSGGTLAAATYYYVITALNAAGETIKSNELSVTTTGTTSSNTLTWTAVTGATSYRVYRGTSAAGENVYYTPGNVVTYVDTGAANTGGSPPAANTAAYGTIIALFVNASTSTQDALFNRAVRCDVGMTYVVSGGNAIIYFGAA